MRLARKYPLLTRGSALALTCSAILAFAACGERGEAPAAHTRAEMSWARAALERNPNLELVATDFDAGVFTVRDKTSGQVHAVRVDELAAAPLAQLTARPNAAPVPLGAEPAPSAADAPVADESRYDDATDESLAQPNAAAAPLRYTIERAGGQVKVSGPGVSIVSAGGEGVTSARGEAGQVAVDPIVCEGRRMMHLDNRRIFVDGDAVTARNGCELHITNSRIVASGTGVVVRDAIVHITNSYIEGAGGSYDAGIGAKLYLRDSNFRGVMHRDAFARIQEQGADVWP